MNLRPIELRVVLRDAWGLSAPYLRSRASLGTLLLLAAIIGLNLGMVGLDLVLNRWNGAFYDTLQQRDAGGFLRLLIAWRATPAGFMPGWLAIIVPYVAMTVLTTYLLQWLQIRWRRWMTGHMLDGWLARHAYYRIALQRDPNADPASDNPDQRIADDIAAFCTQTPSLLIDLLSNFASLASFVVVLWRLSGPTRVLGVSIPGYMVWAGLIFAAIGTCAAHLAGRHLVRLDFLRERFEANFRFALMKLRDAAEGIALLRGEPAERRRLDARFDDIVSNWFALLRRRALLNSFVLTYGRLEGIFPLAIAAPRYFAGALSFGDFTRIPNAFGQVQAALSWFITSYATLAAWAATVQRLASFQRAVQAAQSAPSISQARAADPAATALRLDLPDGTTLLPAQDFHFTAGQSTLIQGPVGSGKSTLFRALAGIWPYGAGSIATPGDRLEILPQRPYLPAGSLRAALTYPAATAPDIVLQEILSAVGLSHLAGRLDDVSDWSQTLSGGQQQLLAAARAILHAPAWLLLDEATAHLDAASEAALYALLRTRLPATTIVSTGHTPQLAALHDRRLSLHAPDP